MTVVSRDELSEPSLAKETHPIQGAPFDGRDVVIQALWLRDRLTLSTSKGADFEHFAVLLSRCIVDREGNRIWSPEQWEVWGGNNSNEAIDLFEICCRLCRMGAYQAKKPDTQTSENSP